MSRGIRKSLSLAKLMIRTQATYPGLNHAKVWHLAGSRETYSVMKAPPGKKIGLGPASSQPQAAFILVAGLSSQENNGPLWSWFVSLPSASVRMQLRCQEKIPGSRSQDRTQNYTHMKKAKTCSQAME